MFLVSRCKVHISGKVSLYFPKTMLARECRLELALSMKHEERNAVTHVPHRKLCLYSHADLYLEYSMYFMDFFTDIVYFHCGSYIGGNVSRLARGAAPVHNSLKSPGRGRGAPVHIM